MTAPANRPRAACGRARGAHILQRMASARTKAPKAGDITIRMDAATRARLDALAKRRGLTTGALLRSLGLEEAERQKVAAELLRELERLDAEEDAGTKK